MALWKYPQVPLALERKRHSEGRELLATGVDLMTQRKQAEAYVIEVLRAPYDFHPIRLRSALLELRKKIKLEKPLAQRELYALPECQNLVGVRRHLRHTNMSI